MTILFAAADRDLLSGFGRLLGARGHRVVTAFDGAQALSRLAEERPDLAVLDESLPRVPQSRLLGELNAAAVPVILLLSERPRMARFGSPALPDSFLCYPFSPAELEDRIGRVLAETTASDFRVGSVEVRPSSRTLSGRLRVTAEEIAFLRSLADGEAPRGRDADLSALVLNEKFSRMREPIRIRYRAHEGYRVVNERE